MPGSSHFTGLVAVLLFAVTITVSVYASGLSDMPATHDPARNGEPALATALRQARVMLLPEGTTALAATVAPDGHWTFVNKAGERFTAANPNEMKRVVSVLAPEAKPGTWPTLVLAEDIIFRKLDALRSLPPEAALQMSFSAAPAPLKLDRRADTFSVQLRPKLVADLSQHDAFDELFEQLAQPMVNKRVRLVALEPGGPQTLARQPATDQVQSAPLPDRIDPYKLSAALGTLRGQTVLVTGRIEAGLLYFQMASAPDRSIILSDLIRAAEASDVDLIVLGATSGRQPGARNWLWQQAQVGGIDAALARADLGDFLSAIANTGSLALTPAMPNRDRIAISATPSAAASDALSRTLGDLTATVTGRIDVAMIQLHLVSSARQRELDRRLIHWLPSWATWGYLTALLLGTLGSAVSWAWWAKLWPPETLADYPRAIGYHAARTVRMIAYVLVFMPLVALAALPMSAVGMMARRQPA